MKRLSLILNINIVICGIAIIVISIIKNDIQGILDMWFGWILGRAIYELYKVIVDKENRNG